MENSPSITLPKQTLQAEIEVNDSNNKSRNYANFEIKKSSIKWLVVFAVVLFVAFLGLLLGSVLLGVKVTKDVEVKDGELVYGKDKTMVVKTTEKMYTHTVSLDTPFEVVKDVQSISIFVPQSGDSSTPGVFKFKVIGFERIPGRKLIFHGHTHHADIQADGSVKIIQAFISNNKKSVELRSGSYATVQSLGTAVPTIVYENVDTCEKLKTMNSNGKYRLMGNLACTLTSKLDAFSGILNGQGYTLTITLNVANSNKEVALFESLNGANIFNLNVAGAFTGVGRCAVFAVEVAPGTVLLSNKATASVTCFKKNNNNNRVLAAAFVAEIPINTASSASITFQYCLSASNITVDATSNAFLGGFFALADPSENVISKYNYFFSFFTNIPNINQFSMIGLKMNSNKRDDPCGNPSAPTFNAFCWIHFQWSSSTGYSDPTETWWECCEGWNPCSGCIYDYDYWQCRFVLCMGRKKKSDSLTEGDVKSVRSLTQNQILNHVHIPYIETNCFIN